MTLDHDATAVVGVALDRAGRTASLLRTLSEMVSPYGSPAAIFVPLVATAAVGPLQGLVVARLRGQEARIGEAYELQAIGAVVVGGTLLSGGVGSMIGTAAGVALLFVIQNLVVQGANLDSSVQQVVSGGFLLVVVILQATVSRRSGRAAA